MSIDRDLFEKRLKNLSGKPERLMQICMEQYDARVKAEHAVRELKDMEAAEAELYRDLQNKYAEITKENASFKKYFSQYEGKLAAMSEANRELQKQYEKAAGENDLLKQANTDLTQRYVEAVESGRITQEKLEESDKEKEELHVRILSLQEQVSLGNRDRFGSTSEKMVSVFGRTDVEQDPLSETMMDPNEQVVDDTQRKGSYSADEVLKQLSNKVGIKKLQEKPNRIKKKGKKQQDFSRMDHVNAYRYDIAELDRMYGKGNYRIVNFNCHSEIRETRPHNYVYNEYTPVIVETRDNKLRIISLPRASALYPGSFVSESLMSSILTRRFQMALPLNRLEKEYHSRGVPLSRQTMSNWIIHFALEIFAPIRERMWQELDQGGLVRQCDETTWRVVIWPEDEDGNKKKNGSRGYLWVHTTGEFTQGHKILIYVFEPSRSADHLRIMLKEMAGYLVSDAYSAYHTIENESGGRIKAAMCWMHCRRMFARAVMVMEPGLDELDAEELKNSPEVTGLLLANQIFEADTPLKKLDSDERYRKRKEKVAPLVEEFFGYVHSVEDEDFERSPKLQEAVTYAINQEDNLKLFLENGSIPLDNGYVERSIKPVALARRNSLFSYTMLGAECNAIMYSIVETARANGADVYTYLKYLLSEVPKHLDGKDRHFLDDMMPWSMQYLQFERYELEHHTDEYVPKSQESPKEYLQRFRSGKSNDVA